MRHEYSNATTKRYMEWLAKRGVSGDFDPPALREIEDWLRGEENYRDPLRTLMNLCVGLREAEATFALQWIACELVRDLEEERAFGSKAEAFFSAVIHRCGVEDYDVVCYDTQHRKRGTLHDVQQETANAND